MIVLMGALCLLCGCAQKEQIGPVDLDLYSHRGFEQQVSKILQNADAYEGAFVRLTGLYHTSEGYAYILRPSIQGGSVGFELAWDGAAPQMGQAILAVGTLESYLENGTRYLQVRAQQLYLTGEGGQSLLIGEETFLADLAALYETADEQLGARVTILGRYAVQNVAGVRTHRVVREAEYLDGRRGEVGLEFLPLSELPDTGSWIAVTGTLCSYFRDGETYLTLADAVVQEGGPGADPVKETP